MIKHRNMLEKVLVFNLNNKKLILELSSNLIIDLLWIIYVYSIVLIHGFLYTFQ